MKGVSKLSSFAEANALPKCLRFIAKFVTRRLLHREGRLVGLGAPEPMTPARSEGDLHPPVEDSCSTFRSPNGASRVSPGQWPQRKEGRRRALLHNSLLRSLPTRGAASGFVGEVRRALGQRSYSRRSTNKSPGPLHSFSLRSQPTRGAASGSACQRGRAGVGCPSSPRQHLDKQTAERCRPT